VNEPAERSSSLKAFDCPGRYEDARGSESITWTVLPSTRGSPPGQAGFELHTAIRGVPYWGYCLEGLSTDDMEAATNAGLPEDLGESSAMPHQLSGDLPVLLEKEGEQIQAVVSFLLNEPPPTWNDPDGKYLRLSITVDGQKYEVWHEWFEDGLQRLEGELPEGVTFVCCVTCLYSDYSPAGHGLLGMSCHRGAKAQYLAVRSKSDYFKVPRTEEVMETHVCPEFQRRIPGTGYRG